MDLHTYAISTCKRNYELAIGIAMNKIVYQIVLQNTG